MPSAGADDNGDVLAILSRIESTQTDIIARLERLEEAQRNTSGHNRSVTTHINHLVQPVSNRALAITEILEAILVQLPVQDLLFAQRVNRRFRAVIQTSMTLQRALHFLPEAPDGKPRINPLLTRSDLFNSLGPYDDHVLRRPALAHSLPTTIQRHIKANKPQYTLAHSKLSERGDGLHDVCLILNVHHAYHANTRIAVQQKRTSFSAGAHASWRRMHICQPPCRNTWSYNVGAGGGAVKMYLRMHRDIDIAGKLSALFPEIEEQVREESVRCADA